MLKISSPFPIFSPEWRAVCPRHSSPDGMVTRSKDRDSCFAQQYVFAQQDRAGKDLSVILSSEKQAKILVTNSQESSVTQSIFSSCVQTRMLTHDHVVVISQEGCPTVGRWMESRRRDEETCAAEPLCSAGPRCHRWPSSMGKGKPSFSPRSTQVLALP